MAGQDKAKITLKNLIYQIQIVLVFSESVFLNLFDPNQAIRLTAAILRVLDLSFNFT